MNTQGLERLGFTNFGQAWQGKDCQLWQKCVRNEKGRKLYFINILQYERAEFGTTFELELQFQDHRRAFHSITVSGVRSVTEAIEITEKYFNKMGFLMYDD